MEKVFLRSDTAGYQKELIKYCAEGEDKCFGKIEFAIGVDVTVEFKKAVSEVEEEDWYPLYRSAKERDEEEGKENPRPPLQEWAEVCFVPQWAGYKKEGPDYRFLAIREPLMQLELSGIEKDQQNLSFPTMEFSQQKGKYKIFGVVTNRSLPGDELIWWHRERCGKIEQKHWRNERRYGWREVSLGQIWSKCCVVGNYDTNTELKLRNETSGFGGKLDNKAYESNTILADKSSRPYP